MTELRGGGRAADMVVAALERRIRSGVLKDGKPLPPERALMSEFGTSRTVVREAVRLLAGRGVVEARPRHRPVVRAPGFDTAVDLLGGVVGQLLVRPGGVRNLFDTRILIEAALAREAALSARRDDIAALKAALQANGAAVADSELFYRTDTAFHAVLYAIPGNPVLTAIHRAYGLWLQPHWSRMPRLLDRNRENHLAHTRIYEAILARDPDAAELALRQHLADAWTQVEATFEEVTHDTGA